MELINSNEISMIDLSYYVSIYNDDVMITVDILNMQQELFLANKYSKFISNFNALRRVRRVRFVIRCVIF